MIKIKKSSIILGVMLMPLSVYAQLSPELARKFPANVIVRINSVNEIVPLSPSKQIAVGNYFIKLDSLVSASISKGVPIADIGRSYSDQYAEMGDILDPVELHDLKITLGRLVNSEFSVALKFRKDLKLSPVQIGRLLTETDRAQYAKEQGISKRDIGKRLSAILTAQQLDNFLILKNRAWVVDNVKNYWHELKAYGLVQNVDSAKIYQANFDFRMKQVTGAERAAYLMEEVNADSIRAGQNKMRPFILWKLDAFNNKIPVSRLTRLIGMRQVLKLSDTQIDSIVNKIIALEKVKSDHIKLYPGVAYNGRAFESVIREILTPRQNDVFLAYFFKGQSFYNADKDWKKLKETNLIGRSTDSAKVYPQIQQYELTVLVTKERNSQAQLSAKESPSKPFYIRKPDLLKKLDEKIAAEADQKHLKDSFSW